MPIQNVPETSCTVLNVHTKFPCVSKISSFQLILCGNYQSIFLLIDATGIRRSKSTLFMRHFYISLEKLLFQTTLHSKLHFLVTPANTPAKCEVDQKNGCQDMWRTHLHTYRQTERQTYRQAEIASFSREMWLQCYADHKGNLTNRCYIRSAGFQKSWYPVSPNPGIVPKLFYPYILSSVMSPPIASSHELQKAKLLQSPHTHIVEHMHTQAPRLSLLEDFKLELWNSHSPLCPLDVLIQWIDSERLA